ncbi:hypothetical protein PA25_33720 [Pseudoalteromonas sp. A25]|uniref:MBL fold metallo-hydrolase n=1 Tax=Pseudoalteromonas sp. A25 TaxID=116092 RepID=UPI001260E86A|nr:MBL fold metallo-hydrolase [Pseudoalteromonas sp. A25]BBN83387.1 hypothetical protein PA25_33720 [Pseudoalteromonas sp. A25]
MKLCYSILLVVLANVHTVYATQSIKTQHLTQHVTLLKSSDNSTNIGMISTSQGLVLIDPMPGHKQLHGLLNTIESLNDDSGSVRHVFNTHMHLDHTGGNRFFAGYGAELNKEVADIRVYRVHSHSSDDFVYFIPQSNVVFVGDVLDMSWHPTFYVGGVKGFNAAIETILNIGNEQTVIVPGHGKVASKQQVKAFRQHTLDWISRVNTLYDAGTSVASISQDPQIVMLIDKFNHDKQDPFLTEKALRRFIKRTISVIKNDKKH